jgi:GMP synthase-like glutamine amidotransferase
VYNADVHKAFPSNIEDYSALAVMGGGMSANDPLLTNRQAEILILQAMYRDIPVIGHCLGGQLMAKALGGKITRSPKPEIGWQPIKYVDDSEVNQWFGDTPTDTVIHWHYETFSIPTGAKLLATNDACTNQCFSIGKHLAMQFHIEMDINKCESWVRDDDDLWKTARDQYDTVQNNETILGGIAPYLLQHQKTAQNIYSHWLSSTEWCEHLTN